MTPSISGWSGARVTIGITHERGNAAVLAELNRSLRDGDVIVLQDGDRRRDRARRGRSRAISGDIPQYVRRRIIGIGNHARHLGIGIAEAAGVPREGLRLFMAGKAKLRAKTLEKLLAAISTPAADLVRQTRKP